MRTLFLAALLLAAPAFANPFPNGEPQTGKNIIDKVGCNGCHARMVGGDGTKIFSRPNRIVKSPKQLVERIRFCSGNIGANLSAVEENHIAAYLNQQYYQFK